MKHHETTAWIYPRSLKDPLLLRRLSRELCGSGYGTSTRIRIALVDQGCFHWFQYSAVKTCQEDSRGLYYILYWPHWKECLQDSWSTEAVDKLWHWTRQVTLSLCRCQEYSDDWYTRNMPRLRDQFRPIFVQEMKRMREQEAALKQMFAVLLLVLTVFECSFKSFRRSWNDCTIWIYWLMFFIVFPCFALGISNVYWLL